MSGNLNKEDINLDQDSGIDKGSIHAEDKSNINAEDKTSSYSLETRYVDPESKRSQRSDESGTRSDENTATSPDFSQSARKIVSNASEENSGTNAEISGPFEVIAREATQEDTSVDKDSILYKCLVRKRKMGIGFDAKNIPLSFSQEITGMAPDSSSGPILDESETRRTDNSAEITDSSIYGKEIAAGKSEEISGSHSGISDPSKAVEVGDGSTNIPPKNLCMEPEGIAASAECSFRIIREAMATIRPVSEFSDDKDVDIEEIFVHTTRINLLEGDDWAAEQSSSKKPQKDSSTSSMTSGDSPYEYRVDLPDEAEVAPTKKEVTSNLRYERNLKKFLKDTAFNNRQLSPKTDAKKLKKTFLKKVFRSDGGTIADILQCCGAFTSVLRKLKIGRKSKSAPPSLTVSSNSDELNPPKTNSCSTEDNHQFPNCTAGMFIERDLAEVRRDEAVSFDKSELTVSTKVLRKDLKSFCDSSESSSDGLANLFKIPVLPKDIEKSPTLSPKVALPSPGTNKIPIKDDERSPSELSSPRRPSNFNVSPRRTVYTWCPSSPTGFFRHYRSLPNISQPPRKDYRRSSINFENYKNNKSVKALFTGEMKPKTPESSRSTVVVEEATRKFLLSQPKVDDLNNLPEQSSDLKQPSESSDLSVASLGNKNKIRKKLIFVSNACENTNVTPTLQDSLSSTEISATVSSMGIEDPEAAQGLQITLIESPPKRKHSTDKCVAPQSTSSITKKMRLSDENDASKTSEIRKSSLSGEVPEDVDSDERKDKLDESKPCCSITKPEDISETSRNTSKPQVISSDDMIATVPVVQFPEEDFEQEHKSKRAHLKRTQTMSPDVVEDITDDLSEKKKKKE